jgi:phosphatidylglycerophosphatase A
MAYQDLKKLNLANPLHLAAVGLGSGLAPKAPGTFGSLAAIPFLWLLAPLPVWGYAAVLLLTFVFGVWCCQSASNAMGVHDHGGIVFDEFVGIWITFFALPLTWKVLLAGFLLFRFFDILKPWPIKWLDQKVEGGFGIMIDDVLAGLFALACMHLLSWASIL